jgi:hypothetical protein
MTCAYLRSVGGTITRNMVNVWLDTVVASCWRHIPNIPKVRSQVFGVHLWCGLKVRGMFEATYTKKGESYLRWRKVSDCANLSRKKYENNAILRDSSLLSSSSLFSALLFPSQVYCALYSSLFYRPLFHSSLLHSTLLHSALLHSTLTHLFSTQPIPSLVSISWLLSALSLDFLLVCDTESRLLNFFWTWHGPDIELALAARLLSGCC